MKIIFSMQNYVLNYVFEVKFVYPLRLYIYKHVFYLKTWFSTINPIFTSYLNFLLKDINFTSNHNFHQSHIIFIVKLWFHFKTCFPQTCFWGEIMCFSQTCFWGENQFFQNQLCFWGEMNHVFDVKVKCCYWGDRHALRLKLYFEE